MIIAALVVFVTSGNESVNKKPDELKTTDFYQLVREGLPDSYDDFANGFENSKSLPFRSRRKLFTACMCRTGNLKAAKISAKT